MTKGIETVLDECLACLADGESLEACLARYPQFRGELEPLLRTALTLRKAYARPAPSQEALARVRRGFLAEAERRQRALAERKRRGWLRWQPQFSLSRGLATALLTLVLLFGLLGGGSIVSANSLPGDPLYGVKRASEKMLLLLTFDAQQRAALERQFESRRVEEVKKVVEQGRQVEVDFAGVVEKVEGEIVFVQGIPLRWVSDQPPAIGTEVHVRAKAQGEGPLEVKALAVREPAPAAAPVASSPTFTATATVSSERRPSDTPAAKPTDKPTPTYTIPPTETARPTETATAEVTATEMPSLTATPTRTPTRPPTATPVPPPEGVKVRIEGRIDEITDAYWTVNGERVLLQQTTRFNLTRAPAQVGGWAVVDALKTGDGRLLAEEIVVMRGAEQPPVSREFSGIIEAIAEGRWTIGGREVRIVGDTVIEGTPAVGALAHVRADQYADGRLVARRIVVESEQVVQFTGIISSIAADRWVIGGQEVWIDTNTQIEGQPTVGAMAEVEALQRADGTLHARRIRVEPPASPEAAAPTAEPLETAVPTAIPTEGASS